MDSCRSLFSEALSAGRPDTLRQYSFLDPACEVALKEIATLAAHMVGMPYAAITLSDQGLVWFKAVCGFDPRQLVAGIELARFVASQHELLVVDDTLADQRFAATPGVMSYPHLRFFAGVPLENGHDNPIGTLLVGDREPRHLGSKQQRLLGMLARQVITQLELAREIHQVHQAENACVLAERQLRHQNKLLQLQQKIAATANEAASAVVAIQTGLELVCAHTDWPVGHCYVLNGQPNGDHVSIDLWHFREPERFDEFCRVTEAMPQGADCGLAGKVFVTGQHACIDNLDNQLQFRRAASARACGLKCAIFIPLSFAGQVVGLLEFFSEKPSLPNDHLLAVLDYAGNQLGQVVGRERTSQAVRDSERRFRDLFESSPDAVFVEDLNGNVLDVNPTACQMHQTERGQLLGKNMLELVPLYLREPVARDFPRLARQDIDYIETECLTKNGTTVPVEIRASCIEFNGQSALLLHVRDISERKQLECQFLQAQRTEAIGQLAGGVAHDFNNILTVITGYAELTLMRGDIPESIRRHLEEVQKAGFRGANLTRQLLAFSRKQVLQPQVLDLNSVVTEVETMLRRLIGENIELVTYPQPELNHVKADPAQLEQVLMNLAVNARDAMPDGGSLIIGTADIELNAAAARRLSGLEPGRYVVLSVTDTGCGMPPEVMAHIFEPFFTTKPVGKGTGLGLATCFGIIKQSGGHIIVESEADRGTKFRIYLPAVTEPATPLQARTLPEDIMPNGTETILLVEDEETVRELAAKTLRELGYTVLEAADGEQALVLAEAQPRKKIDLVLTDVVMPQISGRELADSILASCSTTRILFTSGYIDDKIVPQDILRPGVSFLEKPYTGMTLARKVREVLESGNGEK